MQIGENLQNLIEKYLYATDDEKTIILTLLELGVTKEELKEMGFDLNAINKRT